jgi:hypothetical protein
LRARPRSPRSAHPGFLRPTTRYDVPISTIERVAWRDEKHDDVAP